ncbi:MAG: TIGR00645 family protein [Gammaproteobacteria bacterium]
MNTENPSRNRSTDMLAQLIFWSRWLQAPLYVGLIVAQGVYVFHFMIELFHLVMTAASIGETQIMLIVLGLIDVVMIANLLIMVTIGGYETFVSRLNLREHRDQPEWLSHVNAATMKIKLSMALIGISSIHLLKTFINADQMNENTIKWQVVIHVTFILSAVAMAYTDRIMTKTLMDAHGRIND